MDPFSIPLTQITELAKGGKERKGKNRATAPFFLDSRNVNISILKAQREQCATPGAHALSSGACERAA